MIPLIISAILVFLLISWYVYSIIWCYQFVFLRKKKRKTIVEPERPCERLDSIRALHKKRTEEFRSLPFESVEIRSFDGLTLRGKLYPSRVSDDAVIIFHGYRSSADSDGALIAKHCIDRGFNVLCVHQRAHGESEGKTITFGIRERLDCKKWVDYTLSRLSKSTKIMLMGVSMGASTVMMASDLDMPSVFGIFADCGFSSPREILCSTIKKLSYPVGPAYGLIRTSARIIGRFDPDSFSAVDALSKSRILQESPPRFQRIQEKRQAHQQFR